MLIVLRALVAGRSVVGEFQVKCESLVFLGVWSWVALCCLSEVLVVCYILMGLG